MPERRCAFLRMADASGWSIDADLAFGPLDNLGWYCEWLCWRDRDVLWDDWDGVYLAAPCDYPDDPNSCLEVLGIIDRSRAVLLNPLELVRWNIPKTYLADLERRGADIVPSIWRSGFDDSMLGEFFDAFGGSAIVMKPTVSTNAANTWVLDRPVDARPSRSWNGPLRIVITSCSGSFGTSGSTVNIPCSTWGAGAATRYARCPSGQTFEFRKSTVPQ